jgi:hypothetical protein
MEATGTRMQNTVTTEEFGAEPSQNYELDLILDVIKSFSHNSIALRKINACK